MAAPEMTIRGCVRFHRSDIGEKGPWCICCGEREVPHAHIYSESVGFPEIESRHFAGLKAKNLTNYLEEFIHDNFNDIEGKILTVTFKIEQSANG